MAKSNLQTAQARYNSKTSIMAARWVARKNDMKADWAGGLAKFGVTVGPTHQKAYNDAIDGVTEEKFLAGVRDKGAVWAKNFVAAMSS